MLAVGGYDMLTAQTVLFRNPLDGQIIAFGRTRGEDGKIIITPKQICDLFASLFKQLFGLLAQTMQRMRICPESFVDPIERLKNSSIRGSSRSII